MPFGKILIVLCVLGLAGCTSPGPSARITVAGGQKVIVSMSTGKVEGSDNEYFKVGSAAFLTNKTQKQGTYVFSMLFNEGAVPQSIKIEDVSESKAQLIVDDMKPVLANRTWHFICKPIGADDASMKWIHDIDDSFRVYLFSVTLTNGRVISIYHAVLYPSFLKAHLLRELGVEGG